MIHPPVEGVRAAPFWSDLQGYNGRRAALDLQAGITVAIFAVPQAMAYAMLAGLPPVNGLYAAAVMSIIAALWGASPYINSGPSNSASLLAAAALTPFLHRGGGAITSEALFGLVWQFTLLVGAIRMAMGLFRLGHLVRFVPESAFLGFVVGAGALIALGQLNYFLGVPPSHAASFAGRFWDVLSRAGDANGFAVAIGSATFGTLALFDRFSKRFPVALTAITLATLAVAWWGQNWGLQTVGDVAPIPAGLPPLTTPAWSWNALPELLPAALAVAAIGLIEAVSIGQTLALKHRQPFNLNQEFFGQGLAQTIGAFFGAFPGSGSFSRSALIEQSGGQTRFANVFFGLFTGGALLIAPGLLERIPIAALAGLLLFTGFKLIEVRALRRVWNTDRADFGVLALTFFVTVFVKIEWGFFAGIVAAMAVFLSRASCLQLFELMPLDLAKRAGSSGERRFEERAYIPNSAHEPSAVVALSLHGDLFFGLAPALRAQLGEILREQNPRYLVVRVRRASSIDYSCWSVLLDFARSFGESGGKLYLCGARHDLACVIANAGMSDVVPPEQILAPQGSPWSAFYAALERVAAELEPDAPLSAPWQEQMQWLQKQSSVSHGQDPFNDPATLGFGPT